jgi:predicted kinase
VRVSWSDILKTLGRHTRDRRLLAFEAAAHLMVQALKRGFDVVLDEMNLDGSEVGVFMTRAQMMNCRVEWHNMNQTAEQCKRRNAERGHPVDDMEIERLAHDYANWLKL